MPDGGGSEHYNQWLVWLTTLKALGFTVQEVEAWSSHGANYEQGEVDRRWEGLRDDPEDEARDKLRGHAWNQGWRPTASPQTSGSKNLYRLAEMRKADKTEWVWVADTEEEADRLAAAGMVAVSRPGVETRWLRSYSKALKARYAAVLPSAGVGGINRSVVAAASLSPLAAEVRIVHVEDMPARGVADYLDQGGTIQTLRECLDRAACFAADPGVEEHQAQEEREEEEDAPRWKVSPLLGDAKRLTRMLKADGYFVDAGHEAYYFDENNHKLVPLDEDDRSLMILFGERFSINRRDQLYGYLLEHLLREAYVRGRTALVRRFSYYDMETNTAYLDMGAGQVLKITKDSVEERYNGQDNALFLPMLKQEPWKYRPKNEEDFLFKRFVEPLNFTEDGSELDVQEQRALFMAWMLSLSFESLMPTKVLAAAVGPSGSGKSTMFRNAGQILIGPKFQLSAMSKEQKGEENFFVKLRHSFYCCYDNVDESVRWLPDALAQIATGIERPGRVLYSDDQLLETQVSCMVALTSRTPRMSLRREDVASRTLLFSFEKLKNVRPEYDMAADLERDRGLLMSNYARLVQRVLATSLGDVRPADPAMRMADFARIATWIGLGPGPDTERDHEPGAGQVEQGPKHFRGGTGPGSGCN